MVAKTSNEPLLKDGEFTVEEVKDLNFFDLTGKKASTKGTSCKQYFAELQVSKTDDRAQIFTMFGPTGGNQSKDWRHYDSKEKARKDFSSIIKSKIRKGYKEIDVAIRQHGSEQARQITKAVVLKNADEIVTQVAKSSLHPETQRLMTTLFGATNDFVIQTLKCPLGQLTNAQIDSGRACLNEAKDIINRYTGKTIPDRGKDYDRLHELTNDFYGLIPHNLGSGARGQMVQLLFDDINKINQKEYDLDTLLDAKSIGAVLTNSSVDDKYKSLNRDFEFIEQQSSLFGWINSMIQDTRASNHKHLGKIILLNAWKINRKNEYDNFVKNAEPIAKAYGKQVIPDQLTRLVKERNDVDKEHDNLYKKANIIPLFHGTRTVNLTNILQQNLKIRPSGVVITGAMYGSALYKGFSSKSINYSSIKTSYWAKGADDKAFLFITDCCLGNQKIATGSYQYTEQNIKPHHSVWAKGGYSGVINDEFMLYNTNQHALRYLLEFTCRQ